jgi:hypothetical protein
MGLWLAILLCLGGVLLGSRALRGTGRAGLANSLLMIVAVPGLLAGLLFLALIIINPKWN